MATEDFKVLQKVQDLMEYSYPILCQFPKAERFSFAQDIRHCMNTLLELTITEDKRYIKKSTIENMDIENEKLIDSKNNIFFSFKANILFWLYN